MTERNKNQRPIIGYVLGRFPCPTETFIRNEIKLLDKDFRIVIFSLQKGVESGGELDNNVVQLPRSYSLKLPAMHAVEFLRHPVRYSKTLFRCIREKDKLERCKAFYKAVYFCRFIREYGIRHLHAHFANQPTDVAMMLSRWSGIGFSFSAHAKDIYVDGRRLEEKIAACRFCAVCSRYGAKCVREKPGQNSLLGKIQVVYHGIVLENWPFLERATAKEVKLLSIGRLVEKKGFDDLLEAVAILKERLPGLQCGIVGNGELESELKTKCERLGITAQVTFHGFRTQAEIREMLTGTSVLVQPCRYARDGDSDSIPNVLLEAMASGVPVVSTSVAGITEILNEENSILVEPQNPAAIADAVYRLADDTSRTERTVKNARKTVERYDAGKCIEPLQVLFRNVLKHN